jgi:hypothetical protein
LVRAANSFSRARVEKLPFVLSKEAEHEIESVIGHLATEADARQAHNLKVIGSNPIPATTFTEHANEA